MSLCNEAGINLIKSFEGLRLNAYQDTRGIWTIGYGHTGPEVVAGLTWTEDQAMQAFADDLMKRAENLLNRWIIVALTDNQFSALCSLCYNIGAGNLHASHLLVILNQGNIAGIPNEIAKWCHNHDGSVNPGLYRRREAEVALWSAA